VPYVEIAIRFRRKARGHRVMFAGLEVVVDDLSDEITLRGNILLCHNGFSSGCVLPVLDYGSVRVSRMNDGRPFLTINNHFFQCVIA